MVLGEEIDNLLESVYYIALNCWWKGILHFFLYPRLIFNIITIRKIYGIGMIRSFLIRHFLLFHLCSIMFAHGSSNMHKGTPLIFVEICPPVILYHFPQILISLDVIEPFQKIMIIIPVLLCPCPAIMICLQLGLWRTMAFQCSSLGKCFFLIIVHLLHMVAFHLYINSILIAKNGVRNITCCHFF